MWTVPMNPLPMTAAPISGKALITDKPIYLLLHVKDKSRLVTVNSDV